MYKNNINFSISSARVENVVMENKGGSLLGTTWYYYFGQSMMVRSTSRAQHSPSGMLTVINIQIIK